ncbi:NitT/TauT family transport system permease protein [Oryzomicrobium terrae]|uniref:NitT/TauT family transport system permease protein n=1 Tax=Oryzomicrobium terrae TaxID=1735038 RepID=A0A5C1E7N3_9RHOO|nr:ABC transporter permease subunit [Oryzomicrobium terrae]QEL64624.1 NitT/TauT family transport system permease protein [Oryzomicrobium terrae]
MSQSITLAAEAPDAAVAAVTAAATETRAPAFALSAPFRAPSLAASLARFLPAWESLLLWAVLIAAWQISSYFIDQTTNPLLPAPRIVLDALWDSLPELWKGTVSSFFILVPGYALAVALGVLLGLLAGLIPGLGRAAFPFAKVVAPVPPTVYIPYAIAVLPTFHLSATFVVFIGAFWPVFQNAAAGAHAVEKRYRDNARVLGFSRLETLVRVIFPASLPHIFSGMAVGLGFSFILLTVAELFGANAGLGRFVQYYADFADYPRMVAGILYTGLVTWLAMTGLDKLRHRALFWLR